MCLQLNEALCASSPDLASPSYQSPFDSANTLPVPVRSPRRRSMGVRREARLSWAWAQQQLVS